MRVLQVLKVLRHGGAETVALRLMEAAPESADQGIVAAPGEWSERFPGQHFPMGETSLKPQDILRSSRQIRAAVREFRPDVVHAHSPGTIVAAAVALGTRRGVRFLGTCHGGVDLAALKRQARLYKSLRVNVVSCGPGVTEGLRAGGLEPYATINNGIAAKDSASSVTMDLAEEFGLKPQNLTLAAVARLEPVKNQRQILEALPKAPGVNVLVCGDGSSRPELEALSAELDLGDRVKFLGMRRDIPEIMRSSDGVVLASRVEGLPVSLLEAMAEGAPVVATDVLGSHELIEDGVNGLLVPLDDSDALAAAFRRLAEDKVLQQTLARGGLETVKNYTLEGMTSAYWNLYAQSGR